MAALSALARPYAKAAFSQAKDETAVAEWSDALRLLSTLVQSPQLSRYIGNPVLATDKMLDFILQTCEAANLSIKSKRLRNFITVLVQGRLLSRVPEIYRQFTGMRYKDEGVVPVQVQSAVPLSSTDLDALEKPVAKLFSAGKVELSGKTDQSLLGGLRFKADDRVLDLSLREKLRCLQQAIA